MRATASLALLGLLLQADIVFAQDQPLHLLIDKHLSPASSESVLCSDAEFFRRVSLDLMGAPPTAEEVRAFVADESAEKRTQIVDRLLASPQHTRHLATTLDLMLMERRSNAHVPQDDWHNWLLTSLRNDKPWNVIAREILTADGDDKTTRPAARFFLDRQSEPNLLTRDIGRIFFGRDLQCAQCHDHPNILDYRQADYHGLLAFLAPGYAVVRKETVKEGDKEKTKDVTIHAEKAGSDLTFESVFMQGNPHRTGPRLFDDVIIDEPFLYPGDEYEVAPAEGVKSIPRFSRREKLAELATNGTHRMFNENMANRLWAHMLGRGLVHPVDLHHYENPPTDPELLTLLGERFAAMEFNMSQFLREIALSQAYQRPYDPPAYVLATASEAATMVASLVQEREALQQSADQSSETFELALIVWEAAEAATLPIADELDAARKAYDEARKKLVEAQAAVTKAQAELDQKQAQLTPVQVATDAAQTAVATLPDDKELAAAAAQFAKRAQELTEAVATLTKNRDEKTSAVAGPEQSFAAAKGPVDDAVARLAPLRETLKLAEQTLLHARRQMRADAVALKALDERLEAASAIASLPQLREAVIASNTALAASETEQMAAQQALDQHLAQVTERQSAVTIAETAVAQANASLTEAQAALTKRVDDIKFVEAAAETAQAASEKLPDDMVLAEAAQKLKERSVSLSSEIGQFETSVETATTAVTSATTAKQTDQQMLEQSQAELPPMQETVARAQTAVSSAREQVTQEQANFDNAVSNVTEHWSSNFSLASLKALTPEQLCWSIFQVTGVYERTWNEQADELEKASPLTDEQKQDPDQLADRQREIEQQTYNKLKGNLSTFIKFYGAAAGQPQNDFFATADQAMFAANGGSILGWIAPTGGNVTERIVNAEQPQAAAEELYLSILNRTPSDAETADVTTYLADRDADRAAAAQELVWGLITSAEFRFNH
ncbi:MAG: DUF1549 domain-containing protein [Planctomycetaceae bacterium]|nr:DUF1549 domain-containing protein [Planctomycetaceae bacterium]